MLFSYSFYVTVVSNVLREPYLLLSNSSFSLCLSQSQSFFHLGQMFLTSSNSDVRQFHGAVLVWHKRYAGFLKFVIIKSPRKLIVIFFLSQFSLEDNEYMFIFVFFPKSDDRHKLVLPTRYNIA